MNKASLIVLHFVLFLIGTGVTSVVTLNHVFVIPDNATSDQVQDVCEKECYSLHYVLSNYEEFFVSFTTIELLPGQYFVNDSFGNITIKDIQHFKMIGIRGTSNGTAVVSCTQFGNIGFFFVNVTNVALSNITFSHCTGYINVDVILKILRRSYFLTTRLNDFTDYTLVFAYSSNISLSRVVIKHSNGIALTAVGVYGTFRLLESTLHHNIINCLMITTVNSNISNVSRSIVWHKYQIFSSSFSYGTSDSKYLGVYSRLASGISVFWGHETKSFELNISNVTLYENFGKSARFVKLATDNKDVKVTQVTMIIDQLFCSQSSYLYEAAKIVFNIAYVYLKNFSITNSKFIRSCLELHEPRGYVFIQNSTFLRSPCGCPSALYNTYNEKVFVKHKFSYQKRQSRNNSIVIEDISMEDCCGMESVMSLSFSSITFQGNNTFLRNFNRVFFQSSQVTLKGNTTFVNNTAHGSSLYLEYSTLYNEGHSLFQNNYGSEGGGITLIRTLLVLSKPEKMVFTENHGHNGGALAMYDGSFISSIGCYFRYYFGSYEDYCRMNFKGNVATNFGGAIYVDAAGYKHRTNNGRVSTNCFTDLEIIFDFINNTAVTAGSALYGGWLDFCAGNAKADGLRQSIKFSLSEDDLQVSNIINDLSAISSNPSRVCLCFGYQPDCNVTIYELELLPGQSFQIQAVAVGQRFGTVPSTVFAAYENSSTEVDEVQQVQHVGKTCTILNYTIKTPNTEEILKLYVEKYFIPEPVLDDLFDPYDEESKSLSEVKQLLSVFEELKISLKILKCPLGYSFDSSTNICTCQKTLTRNGIECHLKNQTIVRRNQMWINATFSHTDSEENNPGVIVHHNCPFDYCKNVNVQYLDLRYPNDQCAFGRSGTLCGECPQNHSHVFGTSKCKKCSNAWTVLVIALFILTGIGLVALLIVLNLTVSIGTINGLIFYAQIVRANHASFFPPQMTNTFLSWFIAWINLDLGIEMCFSDGLDAYIKTWLQFLFPIYIWIIVITIIVSSHYYTFAAKLSGSNAVQVLATLFLMSCAKMLRITITALSSTTLDYPDGYSRRVWLYDGSVDYLKGKHIPIFIASLMLLIFLSIPYTLVLLCIQWLRLLPSYRILFWVRKFKPLFDAYAGVYKRQHGYWTGLLLLVRMGLFLVFALNVLGDPSINLLTMAATMFCAIAYLAIFGGVYRQTHINLFEYSYILNLGILSAVTVYTRLEENSQEKVTKTSVGIAFATFILIVCLHAFQRFKSTRKGGIYLRNAQAKFVSPVLDKIKSAKLTQSANATQPNKSQPTHSSIVLREPLLVG